MPKFKVGDRVRILPSYAKLGVGEFNEYCGDEGIVESCEPDGYGTIITNEKFSGVEKGKLWIDGKFLELAD